MAEVKQAEQKFRKTESGKRLTQLMTEEYTALHRRAGEGAFVVWIAIIVPAEIFSGFKNVVFAVPESHAALSAAKGVGMLQCEKAEAAGYSMDICSYARIDLGTALSGGKDSPTFGLPRPHLLVSNNNNCSLLAKWFDVYHREWGVPHFLIDVPFCYEGQKDRDRAYITAQYRDLIKTVEQLSGQTFDLDRVREALRTTREATRHYKRFIDCAAARPSGITAFDSFVQMAPLLTSRGRPGIDRHFAMLADETEERMRSGLFPVPGERYRLFWDSIAPWHQLRKMSARLAGLDANIVAASYTSCVGSHEGSYELLQSYDGGDPLEALARAQNFSVCPYGLNLRVNAMTRAARHYGIDGFVFASNRSCKVYSIMQMDCLRTVSRDLGIPVVMIDVDHADVRTYSEEGAFTRIEALLERIDAARQRAG
ncbi:MAG TPA: 2-hydroxyacyl-CoA dehydratase family protein [Spirochaetota bacterium]|nr:2-hydroxyacyl-CoA dehydratase [Spirochaetota bacterium]HOD14934.1 2-hydroxyacyl-CoA dehydratase family protein [Spirochaetota bacterium]HPG52058.1 2-hydroxyacyl-CoA dehydratase family protein [Spirochaetota bacterium]HPN12299.1 2-hydroxyacyl-CoA dehydratase family protein [Spirochaetota bacterium]HQL82067.1 2-hydroxyacyl-CoA dehydratase family protein [Spirochaetota bacterium]